MAVSLRSLEAASLQVFAGIDAPKALGGIKARHAAQPTTKGCPYP